MAYRTPEQWRLVHRGPQHAAPLGVRSTPLRLHAHRALRLFVTAGAWGAGLCLVLGLVTMVAEAAGPSKPTPVTAAAGRLRLVDGHGGRTRPGTLPGGAAADVRIFSGTGDATTGLFTVARHSRWELQWSYACPARTPGGNLIVREGAAGASGASVAAAGKSGQGSTWTYSDTGTHYLVVITSCGWTVKVVSDR
jgi:hypothetical protein